MLLLVGKTNVFASEAENGNPIANENPVAGENLILNENPVVRDNSVVKVGWFESDGYFEKDQNGNLIGFGVDYLESIAAYTGWEYEFVEGTREKCLTMLQNGKIDLMSPVRIDLELQNARISDEVIGESYGYIYKLSNNRNISYEEYPKFSDMTVGIEKGNGIEKEVAGYCEEHRFQFSKVVYYDTVEEMKQELAEGKIDAIIVDSYVNVENLKVIGRFSNSRVTFAVSDNGLWKQLNQAIESIKLDNPKFTEDLRQRYFSGSSQSNLEYSMGERNFLAVGRTYNVVLAKNQYPFSYKDMHGSGQKGMAVDLLKSLEEYSGISFNIIYTDSYAQAEQMLLSGEADILGGTMVDKKNVSNVTESIGRKDKKKEYVIEFYDMEMAFIGRKGTNMDSYLHIAVPTYVQKCIPELESRYPDYQFIVYGSDEECLDAVLSNKVDAAIQSDLKINEMTIFVKYKELQKLKFIPGNFAAAFTIHTADATLINVLNKTLNNISKETLDSIKNNNIQHITMEGMSLGEFTMQYRGYFAFIIVVVGLVNLIGLGYRKYQKELIEKEKAYNDSVANVSSMEKFRIDTEVILNSQWKVNYYMLSVDIDQFKIINDLYGYEEGDKMIAYLGAVLKKRLNRGSCITRSGAECFIIFKKAEKLEEVEEYLQQVFAQVEADTIRDDSEYKPILKAGVYKIAEDDFLLSSIIDKSNIAKSNLEKGHESAYALYSEAMRQTAIEEKRMENNMEKALEAGQFKVYLQPQVDLKTGKIVSAEALVRWIDPEKGLVPPFKFIPLFEKNGFISKLDYFVWEESIRTLAKWRDNSQIMVPISINLSRVDIQKAGMIEETMKLLDKYSLHPKWLKAELTESVCLENDKMVMEKMELLKSHGLKIAMDDFGSGYSSLHMLKSMPIDILKIDKSFLDYKEEMQEKDEILIRDVVELGKHLRMQIVVEGVETLEQSDFLAGIGCDIAQGYYYGRPMPIAEFEQLLEEDYKEKG